MADIAYNRGKYLLSTVGSNGITWRAAVVTGTAVGADNPDLNTVADLDAVASVTIHTERLPLASVTVTEDDANDRVNVDCANLTFAAAAGVTARALVLYHEGGGTDATRELALCYTTGFPQPMDGGLSVTINDYLRTV